MTGRHLLRDVVPEDIAEPRRVRLRRARDNAASGGGELERVLDYPADGDARENARLEAHLQLTARMSAPADTRVLALGVLADEEHVDGGPVGERRRDSLEEARRPDVRPEVEPLAQRQQQPPQRHVVGHGGIADGAEQQRVESPCDVERVRRHHRAGLVVVRRAPGQLVPRKVDPEGVDDLARLRDDLRPRAVTGDHRDPMGHVHLRALGAVGTCDRPQGDRDAQSVAVDGPATVEL